MQISDVSIRRPVLATVMSLVILLLGIIGYSYLGVREYPSVDPPVISVSTNYTGANAEIIESQITEPLEESISGIAGIKSLTSTSRDGRSTIRVEFDIDFDMESAANDVRDRVSRAVRRIPPDTDPPIVSKADADAFPIIFLNIHSKERDLLELSDMADRHFKERLQTIEGVSQVNIWGEKRYSMRMIMNPELLFAYGLTPLDVRNAVQRQNIELPSGRIEGANTELTIRTIGRINTPEEFNNLIIREENGHVIRFRDIGNAEYAPHNERTLLKRDGIPMVGVVLVPQPGSNHIDISNEFHHRVAQIEKDLPADIQLNLGFDSTEYVRQSIREVRNTVFAAFFVVLLVIFLFLRDWRTTLIPVVTIPISLIGTFFIMYAAGFTINVLTMLGIVLAIGIVVDDAIVMMENIYTKIESGMHPREAGTKGAKEIFFAIIATTLALVAVFFPIIFLGGLTGRLFREFGMVIAGAVIISSFVALTFTPMLSTRILKKRKEHNWFYTKTEPFFKKLTDGYKKILSSFLERRGITLIIISVAILMLFGFGSMLQSEMAPLEDRSDLRIFSTAPEGATFDYMENYMDQLYRVIEDEVPELEGVITVTSPGFGAASSVNSGFVRIMLTDPSERDRSQQEIADALTARISELTGARSFVTQQQTLGDRRGGLPVQFVLQAPDFKSLIETIPLFLQTARDNPVFTVVDVNLKFSKPELQVEIDRDRASSLGISVADISQTLQTALSEMRYSYFIRGGKEYEVVGQMDREARNEPSDLQRIYIRNNSGQLVRMDNLVNITESTSPPQLFRHNRYVSATVSAGLAPGYTIGDGIEAMQGVADEALDERFATELDGPSKDFAESSDTLILAFILALLLAYLVLSAQFESFRDPLIIFFTVPLALAGAVCALWLFGQTLNIFSQIGIIMLIGLVTKNGILIVEFANQRKAAGLEKFDAIKDAAAARFRPILMTSLTTIFGYMPIALALGAGSESRISIGIAVIGGLIFSSVLTLLVIPGIYTYMSSSKAKVSVEDELG